MSDYERRYLGLFSYHVDCNDCKHLNITEYEQRNGSKKGNHVCEYYQQRVIHRADRMNHDPFIYPCKQCYDNHHEKYEIRYKVLEE